MKNDIEMVGKQVKDMYGASMGKVVGIITDIDGSVQFVGVYSGYDGLRQIAYEQLVVQNDSVIFIPLWRLDSQKLIREKNLTLRRLKSLIEIVADNDELKQDAEIAYSKYKVKIQMMAKTQEGVKTALAARLEELEAQLKVLKILVFDAKVQLKSNEMSEGAYESVKMQTSTLTEYVTHETAEIADIQRRLEDLDMEVMQTIEPPKEHLQQSATIYLQAEEEMADMLPKAPTDPVPVKSEEVVKSDESPDPPQGAAKDTKSDWLSRMEAQ